MQRHAFDLDRLADAVARGAGDRRDDRQLGAGQRVEQRALADVGLAGQHHADALAQQRALLRAVEQRVQRLADVAQLAAGIGLLQEVDLLLGKVQRRFDQHAQPHQTLAQALHLLREHARQRAPGRARCRFGAGVDQVGHGLGLGQVELAVEEGALGEFARLGQPQAQRLPGLQAARQQQLQQHRAAMGLQLEHVFAGVGMRRRKVQRQALVDGLPSSARNASRVAWRGRSGRPHNASTSGCSAWPGQAHDAHRAAARRGGDGDDGQGATRQHAPDRSRGPAAPIEDRAAGRMARGSASPASWPASGSRCREPEALGLSAGRVIGPGRGLQADRVNPA